MKQSFRPRLRAIQSVTAFTVTDMAHWFGVKRTTMSHWLAGRTLPLSATYLQLEAMLDLLERAYRSKKFAKKLPVPLSVGLTNRFAYIEQLKAYAIKTLSKHSPAGSRSKVPGNHQQETCPPAIS